MKHIVLICGLVLLCLMPIFGVLGDHTPQNGATDSPRQTAQAGQLSQPGPYRF